MLKVKYKYKNIPHGLIKIEYVVTPEDILSVI